MGVGGYYEFGKFIMILLYRLPTAGPNQKTTTITTTTTKKRIIAYSIKPCPLDALVITERIIISSVSVIGYHT